MTKAKRVGVRVAGAQKQRQKTNTSNKYRKSCQTNNSTYRGNGAWSSGEDSHNGGGGDEEELHCRVVGTYVIVWCCAFCFAKFMAPRKAAADPSKHLLISMESKIIMLVLYCKQEDVRTRSGRMGVVLVEVGRVFLVVSYIRFICYARGWRGRAIYEAIAIWMSGCFCGLLCFICTI